MRLTYKRSILMASSLVLALASLVSLPIYAASDNTAPTLTNLTVSTSSVDVRTSNQSVSIEVQATDDMSGVGYVGFMAKHPQGTGGHDLSAAMTNSGNGTWTGDLEFQQYISSGQWELYVAVYDNAGNSMQLEGQQLTDRGLPGWITVQSNPDTNPPELHSLTASATSVDVTAAAQTINIEIRVSDAVSGVSSVGMMLASPGSLNPYLVTQFQLITNDNGVEVWQGTVQIPRYVRSGTWPIILSIHDAIGNNISFDANTLASRGFPSQVQVLSDDDVIAPTLTNLTISPTSVNTYESSQTVTVRITSTDDKSGVSYSTLGFRSPSGTQSDAYPSAIVNNSVGTSGDFTLTITIPRYAESGTWKASIYVSDAVGNYVYLDHAQLVAAGWPSALTVENNPGGSTTSTSSSQRSSSLTLPSLPSSENVFTLTNGTVTQVLEYSYPALNTVMYIPVPDIFPVDAANHERYIERLL